MQFLAPNALLSKINPDSLQHIQTPSDSDSLFDNLPSQSNQPDIRQLDEFIDEIPRQLAKDQYFKFFGDVEDELNNSIKQLMKGTKKKKV